MCSAIYEPSTCPICDSMSAADNRGSECAANCTEYGNGKDESHLSQERETEAV